MKDKYEEELPQLSRRLWIITFFSQGNCELNIFVRICVFLLHFFDIPKWTEGIFSLASPVLWYEHLATSGKSSLLDYLLLKMSLTDARTFLHIPQTYETEEGIINWIGPAHQLAKAASRANES